MANSRIMHLKSIFWFGMMNLSPIPGNKRYIFFRLGGGNSPPL